MAVSRAATDALADKGSPAAPPAEAGNGLRSEGMAEATDIAAAGTAAAGTAAAGTTAADTAAAGTAADTAAAGTPTTDRTWMADMAPRAVTVAMVGADSIRRIRATVAEPVVEPVTDPGAARLADRDPDPVRADEGGWAGGPDFIIRDCPPSYWSVIAMRFDSYFVSLQWKQFFLP
jgi:hypothetical protein